MTETLSQERKRLQREGVLADWVTTASYQMLKSKYLGPSETQKQRFETISRTLSSYLPDNIKGEYEGIFFNMLWKGWLSPATSALTNIGTDRGFPIACSGQKFANSIDSIYSNKHEMAMLTKRGFGTSADLSDICPRGTIIKGKFKATGLIPVLENIVSDIQYVVQGARRGSFASYIDIEHGDFYEVINMLLHNNDDLNIGWIIKDSFIDKLLEGDIEANKRYSTSLQTKLTVGKGYYYFQDRANRQLPQVYKDQGLKSYSSGLCNEILSPASKDYTYSCILSSLNLAKYDEWKDTDTIFHSTVFLDCIASYFIDQAEGQAGMAKVIKFTKQFRSLGLGVMGFHTALQQRGISWGSLEAMYFNREVFSTIQKETLRASKWVHNTLGSSDTMAPTGRANASLVAVAPTLSTSLIMGGVSPGIEPFAANVFVQSGAVGEVYRINPEFLKLLKSKGIYNDKVLKSIEEHNGSCQHLDELTPKEKLIFRTAFEVDQEVILRLASQRQEFIDHGQSLNLFFASDAPEEEVGRLHQIAFTDERLLGLYYIRTMRGKATKLDSGCEGCDG